MWSHAAGLRTRSYLWLDVFKRNPPWEIFAECLFCLLDQSVLHCVHWPLTFALFALCPCRGKWPARCRRSHRTAPSTRSPWCWPSWAWACPTTVPNRWQRRCRQPSPHPEPRPDRSDEGDKRTSRWDVKEVEPGKEPHFSHLAVIITLRHWISGIPQSTCAEVSGLLQIVFSTFCYRDLEGFKGATHLGSWRGLVSRTGLGLCGGWWTQMTVCWVWPLVVTKVHSCSMQSVLLWAQKRGKLLQNCELKWCIKPVHKGLKTQSSNFFKGELTAAGMYLVTKWWQA